MQTHTHILSKAIICKFQALDKLCTSTGVSIYIYIYMYICAHTHSPMYLYKVCPMFRTNI